MKKSLFILGMLAGLSGFSQGIGNPGFENWTPQQVYSTDTLPMQWSAYYCNTVTRTTDAIEGNYAARITGWFACGIAPGMLVNGNLPFWGNIINAGTPFSSKPSSISAYYKLTDAQLGDSAVATIILKKWNAVLQRPDTVAIGTLALGPVASYTMFTVNLADLQPSVMPDSIIMAFESSKYFMFDMNTMALPSLYIDKIKLPETASGISETAGAATPVNTFPNPFSALLQLSIERQAGTPELLTLQLCDMTGKEVRRYEQIRGDRVQVARGDLAAGTYFYRLTGEGRLLATGKVTAE